MSTPAPPLELLWPPGRAGAVLPAAADERELAHLLAYPASCADGAPWVRATTVTSADGAVAGADGRSASVGTAADLRMLVALRSVADVVLVGAGTVRAEGYRPPRRREAFAARRSAAGQRPLARLAVVTRTGDLPDLPDQAGSHPGGAPADHGRDDDPVLVITCEAAGEAALARLRSHAGTDAVLVAGDREVDLRAAVDALAGTGSPRVLCEGGPQLLGALADVDRLDELVLSTSPLLVGGPAPRLLHGRALGVDGGGLPLRLVHLLHHEGTLLAHWSRRPALADDATSQPTAHGWHF